MDFLLDTILSIPGIFLTLSFKQFAQVYVAYLMGDNTARYDGRLTLNPFAHLDILGTLCILFFRFGWTKPVRINENNFKNRKWGTIAVCLAGPVANLLLATVFMALFKLIYPYIAMSKIAEFFSIIFNMTISINVGLMIFNLIPIPPLDGSRILMEFLPSGARRWFYSIERYSIFILLILLYTNILNPVFMVVGTWVYKLINYITFFI